MAANFAACDDEQMLAEMLEEETDFDRRSAIRARLTEVKKQKREMREANAKRREDDREQAIKNKAAQAVLQKQRTLDMFDAMAKSGPAGSTKVMDVGIYRSGEVGEGVVTSTNQGLVDDAIKETARQRELEKKRMLAAFDAAAKSGPAGAPKEVNFAAFRKANVEDYEPNKREYDPTMQMSGGIPVYNPDLIKSPALSSAVTCSNGPDFVSASRNIDPPLDPMQRAIRERQDTCDAEKKRILAAYAAAAKQGPPGPKQNVLDDIRSLSLDENESDKATKGACAGFKSGVPLEKASSQSPRTMRSTCFNPAKAK